MNRGKRYNVTFNVIIVLHFCISNYY